MEIENYFDLESELTSNISSNKISHGSCYDKYSIICRDKDCKEFTPWPAAIWIAVVVIILLVILFSNSCNQGYKSVYFFVVLILGLIWLSILIFMCRSGQFSFAWFLLLLPVTLGLTWFIACNLSLYTTSEHCCFN